MIERALIHVAGPAGSGKTTFIESMLHGLDGPVLAARCIRDDALREPRESAPKTHPELRRYRKAGASGGAVFAFPQTDTAPDAFFTTDLMQDYSRAVVLEGDNPIGFADLGVFVAPALAAGDALFVRRKRDRAKEERAKADALERLLREPDGVAELLGEMIGGPIVDLARRNPRLLEEARANLLAGIASARKAPPPTPTEHWSIAAGYQGIEQAQLVVVDIRSDLEREHGERLVADVVRLRKDDALFRDILGFRGHKIPITAVVANLKDQTDVGCKKAIARVKRALKRST